MKIVAFWKSWKEKLVVFLQQGLSPHKFASAIALGSIIGFFPVIGTTTIISGLLAIIFKLNMGLIQIANYAVYPLQILLIVPEIKMAHKLFFSHLKLLKLDDFLSELAHFDIEVIKTFSFYILLSVIGWVIIAIPTFIVLYLLSKKFAQFYLKKRNRLKTS